MQKQKEPPFPPLIPPIYPKSLNRCQLSLAIFVGWIKPQLQQAAGLPCPRVHIFFDFKRADGRLMDADCFSLGLGPAYVAYPRSSWSRLLRGRKSVAYPRRVPGLNLLH